MKQIKSILIALLILQNPAIGNINTDIAIINLNKKIKTFGVEKRQLLEKIEQLEEKQLQNSKKIKELFYLVDFEKKTREVKKISLKSINYNKKSRKQYTEARDLLMNNQYNKAIKEFKLYLKQYPKDAHAADALYWLAKSYLIKEEYAQAKIKFMLFQKKYPKHSKKSNSLLELSKIHIKLNEKNSAKKTLNNFLAQFPKYKKNDQVKKMLQKINEM